EFIHSSTPHPSFWEHFGQSLAALHRHRHHQYGLHFDNYIGSLPQHNAYLEDGLQFFIERRLKAQAGLALYENKISPQLYERINQLAEKLGDLLPPEPPALLHGDLWSGNFMVNHQGQATIIDPATYFGNREAEIAFTQLFGGFDQRFYQAYQAENPLTPGFDERKDIYNLYPLLVHVNLFGSGYLSGVERTLSKYLG
ncbi:MAG: fructosamine kinase family protein, partial [Bacteroidia bacterium]|nr:fructosamine kinase family protein [Bacteroidia bacterium]